MSSLNLPVRQKPTNQTRTERGQTGRGGWKPERSLPSVCYSPGEQLMGASLKLETHDPAGWRARAAACRAMAAVLGADSGQRILVMAADFEQKADEMERAQACGETGSG